MGDASTRWAIVLGGGDGTRLRALTTAQGTSVPKQFCSFNGGPSLLQQAVRRANRLVPRRRVLAVVAAGHRVWWESDLNGLPQENVVVQPRNCGTAAGILLPLAALRARDPRALTAILPSDHYVRDEAVLERVLDRAFEDVARERECVILLGIEPDAPDTGYGWIVPGPADRRGTSRVRTFVEKPPQEVARALMQRGGVWNSFLLVGSVETLWRLYERHLPELARRFAARGAAPLEALYRDLPSADFSRDLLEAAVDALRLRTVPDCGWSDLGTPARVAECAGRIPRGAPVRALAHPPLRVDLALASVG